MLPDQIVPKALTLTRGADDTNVEFMKTELGKYASTKNRAVGSPLLLTVKPASVKTNGTQGDRASVTFILDDLRTVNHASAGGGETASKINARISINVQYDRPKAPGLSVSNPYTPAALRALAYTLLDSTFQDNSASSVFERALGGQW